MKLFEFCCYNESDPLTEVVIGTSKGYRQSRHYIELVNTVQKRSRPPSRELLKSELKGFKDVLESFNINVIEPSIVGKIVYDQLTPRDIGIVIGDKMVLCNMAKASRRYEIVGLFDTILKNHLNEPNILIPPPECIIEGGDVIVDKKTIYVGLSSRTNRKGFEFIQKHFSNLFDIFEIQLSCGNSDRYLHLDCIFNPVGLNHGLIYAEGVHKVPNRILDTYSLIDITATEQAALATNVLSISYNDVISRNNPECQRVNTLLRKYYNVSEIPFDAVPLTGGSLRCSSLPLYRTNNN
jgi:N-dimethylarginine dimethylaminohydrolase